MKNKLYFVVAGGLVFACSCPVALAGAKGDTNEYFSNSGTGVARTVMVDQSRRIVNTGATTVERTTSLPVMIEGAARPPVIIEDRIIKQKHFFGIGIWPLFDFEIL